MGSEHGFEYSYRIWRDEEIFSRYDVAFFHRNIKYLFEVRTKFSVRGCNGVYKVIDSEMYDTPMLEDLDDRFLAIMIRNRLRHYWMPEHQIKELAREAVAVANQSVDHSHPILITPVAVDLDVCTVQREDEDIDATIDRAMRSDYLFPLHLLRVSKRKKHKHVDPRLEEFLRDLPRTRVETVDKTICDMEECPICFRKPIVGVQICKMECNHVFHYHCIVRWLEDNKTCPMCRRRIHNFTNSTF